MVEWGIEERRGQGRTGKRSNVGTRNEERGTENEERGTGNGERGTRNEERGTGNGVHMITRA